MSHFFLIFFFLFSAAAQYHCVVAFCVLAMSHAHAKEYWLGGSSLTQEPILFCMHTANAATASEKHSAFQLCVREPGGMANCVDFLLCQIRRMPRQLNTTLLCSYGGIGRRGRFRFCTTLLCSYGGIGRRGRFRFCWATPVQVQVLLAAFFIASFLTFAVLYRLSLKISYNPYKTCIFLTFHRVIFYRLDFPFLVPKFAVCEESVRIL